MRYGCDDMSRDTYEFLKMMTEIVVAFLSKNASTAGEVPDFMQAVHATLVRLEARDAQIIEPPNDQPIKPAVPISNSISPDRLTCVECGKKAKSLKFHLRSHGLTPESYRAKWGLPLDYPMVAPNFSATRKALAQASNFGHRQKGRGRRSIDEVIARSAPDV